MNPKVSVISTYKNAGVFIDNFLLDIQRQTVFSECEFLFIDDSSQDGESEKIKALSKKFPENIKLIFNEGNLGGLYRGWNIGIRESKAKYITNWNLDDRRTKDSIEKQLNCIEDGYDVVYGKTLITLKKNEFPEDCKSTAIFPCGQVSSLSDLLANNSPHCLPMWRKSIHEKIGYFDVEYSVCADYEMWLRAITNGFSFKMIDSVIGSYYRNPNGLSSGRDGYKKGLEEISRIKEKYA